MSSVFLTTQQRIADLLKENVYISENVISVITEEKGDLASLIDEELQKLGIGICVRLGPGERIENPPADYQETTKFIVSIVESPTMNTTDANAVRCVEEAINTLHGQTVKPGGINLRFYATGHSPVDLGDPSVTEHQIYIETKTILANSNE
ncbi:MAG: hypothetical protein JW739_05665 [Opitutales bacterium]|nr:hypothetical protein [Opitutales bacterium]